MMGDLTFDQGDWNEEIQHWCKKQGWGHWKGIRYSAMRWNNHILFLLIHNKDDFEYVEGEKWIEVSTISDYSHLKYGAFNSLNTSQRKMIRDFGIYKAALYLFETYRCDGIYGIIEEDNGTVHRITDRINGIKKVAIDRKTSDGVQLYHWQMPRSDWETQVLQNRALTAALDI